ncbi:MAG: hypothetical protein ACMG6E_07960 [Candidatus Roizmanbacteria bacterium]
MSLTNPIRIGGKNTKKNGSVAPQGTDNKNGTILSKEELKNIRDKTDKGQKSDAIVISKQDMQRMKESTKIQSKEQEAQHRKLLEE